MKVNNNHGWETRKRKRGATHRLGLERLDGLDVHAGVVRDGFKVAQDLLRLVDDGLVLQDGAVVRKVDGRRLRFELACDELGVRVALAERLQGSDGL